jgi:hypothetical protein
MSITHPAALLTALLVLLAPAARPAEPSRPPASAEAAPRAGDVAPSARQAAPSAGAPAAASAEAPSADDETQGAQRPNEPSPQPPGIPIYVPPSRGTTHGIRVGAATRGLDAEGVQLEALAPDHVAFTTREQPVLWWYLPAATEARVDFMLVEPSRPDPLFDLTLSEGAEAGLHALPLAERGVRLRKGVAYQWLVALVERPSRGAPDLIAGGVVQRVDVGPELRRALAASPAHERWRAYARYGVWYDALSGISEQIRARPGNARLHDLRAQLLREGGLPGASAWDSAAARAAAR